MGVGPEVLVLGLRRRGKQSFLKYRDTCFARNGGGGVHGWGSGGGGGLAG